MESSDQKERVAFLFKGVETLVNLAVDRIVVNPTNIAGVPLARVSSDGERDKNSDI